MPPSATNFIMGAAFVTTLVSVFGIIRNSWVYRARMKILYDPDIQEALRMYNRLPSYLEMMRRFWIWRVEEFLK